MKYVIVVGLILIVVWAWRSSRQNRVSRKNSPQAASNNQQITATQIVACQVCGLHLPQADALAGKQGLYCSIAHRQQAGD